MIDIQQQVIESIASRRRIFPVHKNRASTAGHSCLRFLVYERTRWTEKAFPDVTLQSIFEGGSFLEDKAYKDLEAAGFKIIEQQRPFVWPKYELSGRLDAKIVVNGNAYPLEVKTMTPHIFEKVKTITDMMDATQHWVRHYPAQLLLYMLMSNNSWGLFYLVNKITYLPKVVTVSLWEHSDYLDVVLNRLEMVNKHYHAGTVPEPIEYDEAICGSCGYFHLCLPDHQLGAEVDLAVDDELLEALKIREEYQHYYKLYREADEYAKKKLTGRGKIIIGDYLCTGKQITRIDPARDARTISYWKTSIQRIGHGSADPNGDGQAA